MKRLIMVSIMAISGLVYGQDGATPPVATQSNDATSKNVDNSISVENVHHINLDTTEVDGGGNWLNKRIWYERAQAVFDEIRGMVNAVADIRIQFTNEVNAVGKKIDSFWEVVDFKKGELDDRFKEILAMLDTEQRIVGDLSAMERDLQTSIKQELPLIDQIGKDITSVHDMDIKIDQTLMQALKTIDECRDYESKSWDSFKAIAKELDDKKARNIYYQMNNYKQNIDQKSSYLKSTLLPYLHNVLVAKVEMNITKINQAIESLKSKGIDLEKIMSKTQENDAVILRDREKAAAEIAVKKALEEEELKAKKIAEKVAKELEEAHKNSFTNVVNGYYQATIGKIVGFVHQGFVGKTIDTAGSYSYPIATYMYDGFITLKKYIHNKVESITVYFGSNSQLKKASEVKKEDTKKVSDVSAEKKVEKSDEHGKDVSVDKNKDEKKSSIDAGHSDATTSAIPSENAEVKSSEESNVVVQSIEKNSKKEPSSHSFYNVFTTILDFIGTVVVSLYNCILQFFKLLMSFSAYIMSGN